jgi:RNA polymerase sigma-70 factor (ECF subfamily)
MPTAAVVPDLESVYEAEASYVWRTLRRLGVAERDLEDVTHDVFLAVHRRLASYDASRPLRPWLFGVALRVASDYRHRARHRRELLPATEHEPTDDAPLPDERLEEERARALVLRALDAVEIERRSVLVMHDLDGFGVPEIAVALELPLNTAYSRLRLARQEIARAVRAITGGQRDG